MCKGGDGIFGIPNQNRLTNDIVSSHYSQYYGRIFKQLYYMLGNNEVAEDITQEVFIKYLQSKNPIEAPGPWLSKVATHTAVSYIRGQRGKNNLNEVLLDEMIEETADCFLIEDHIVRNETILQVRKALSTLPENQRKCLLLKFSGFSYDEIHSVTQIPKGNIGQMIARGKEKFMSHYNHPPNGKDGETHVL